MNVPGAPCPLKTEAIASGNLAANVEAGASGVLVGRSVWAEAATLGSAARESFLMTAGRERLRRLADLVDGDLAGTTDYRSILAEALEKRCGAGSLTTVFPGLSADRVGAFKQRV